MGEKEREMGEGGRGSGPRVWWGKKGDRKKKKRKKLGEGIILYNICKCNPKLKLKTNGQTEKFI